jgi:hypothetical protein
MENSSRPVMASLELLHVGCFRSFRASKLKVLGMVNTGETIPNPFDFAQGSAALEAATLPGYQIEFDRLLSLRAGCPKV